MTVTKTLTIWCEGTRSDGSRCHHWSVGDGAVASRATEIRQQARREGWVRRGGKDYCCPEHVPRGEESP